MRFVRASLRLVLLMAAYFSFSFQAIANPSPFELEVLNIKPAGTGTPSIPASNRIFRAYPGIPYNVRPAVIGGVFPYNFSLTDAPEGMSINPDTGEISWLEPRVDSGPISLIVKDSTGTTVTTSWEIEVSTSPFVFLDRNYGGESTGTIDKPFKTIDAVLANSSLDSTVYVRQGEYSMPQGEGQLWLNNSAHQWIAFPGERVTIYGPRFFRTNHAGLWLDGIDFVGFSSVGLVIWGGHSYQTIRRCVWRDIANTSSVNENQGFIYATTTNGASRGYGLVVQDNDFRNFAGAQAIGSLYSTEKTLIEGNTFREGGRVLGHHFATPIGLKGDNLNSVVRGNRIFLPDNATGVEIYNEYNPDGNIFEWSYNLILGGTKEQRSLVIFYPRVYMYRNTFVNLSINWLPHLDQGQEKHVFSRNVLVHVTHTNPENVAMGENLEGAISDGIVDANGNLTPAFGEFLGAYGYQAIPGLYQSPKAPEQITVQ